MGGERPKLLYYLIAAPQYDAVDIERKTSDIPGVQVRRLEEGETVQIEPNGFKIEPPVSTIDVNGALVSN